MPLSWEDAQTLLAVAEAGSFSNAARNLAVGQPTVSRRIRALERSLGQQLFVRGRHGAQPTAAAQSLTQAAGQMARWAAEFSRAVAGTEQQVSGTVRIAAPPAIAVEQLAPFAARLKRTHPDITLDILSAVDHVDLTRGAADIAVRTQRPGEPELVALHEGRNLPGVYGAPAYVATLSQPCSLTELDWVTWSTAYRHVVPRPMLERLIPGFAPVFTSDDYLVQKAAVRSGLGAMIMGQPAGPDLEAFVPIDIGVQLPAYDFYLVAARSMQHVPRVATVVRELAACFGDYLVTPPAAPA